MYIYICLPLPPLHPRMVLGTQDFEHIICFTPELHLYSQLYILDNELKSIICHC